jgi:hypothetical protein
MTINRPMTGVDSTSETYTKYTSDSGQRPTQY